MADSPLTQQQLSDLINGLTPPTLTTFAAPICTNTPTDSPFRDDNPQPGSPSNIPNNARGNAANTESAIKKSNQTVAHACDSSSYVGIVAASAGAFAGQVIMAIRATIKAIQAALGINPSSTGLANKLSAMAQWLKDQTSWILKISNAMQQFITYTNAIKQFLTFILSMPAVLLQYFKDCVSTLRKQLVAGYKSAFDSTPDPTDAEVNSIQTSLDEAKKNLAQFNSAVKLTAATTAAATISLTTPATINSGNTQMQQAATQAVFTAAGFPDQSKNYGGRP